MAQCELTDELITKIGDDMANILMEAGLDDLPSSTVRSNFRKLFESFNGYFPRDKVIKAISDVANEYGIMGEACFFDNEADIEQIISDGGKLNFINGEDNTTGKLEESERNIFAKDVKKDFLIKAYGTATDVRTAVEREASIALSNAVLINREKGRPVITTQDINQNIREYHQLLLDKIVEYLRTYYDNPHSTFDMSLLDDTQMYKESNGRINYTSIVHKLEPYIKKALSHDLFPDEILEKLFQAKDGTKEKVKLEAYNAWQLLSHFDSLMKVKYGKSLEIADFGDMFFNGEDKYRRADRGANNKTSWRTSDEIKLNEEIDNSIQELISSTPLLNYNSETQLGYMSFGDFSDILSRIKDEVFKGEDLLLTDLAEGLSPNTLRTIKGESIKSLINKLRINPQKYLSAIFEILSNPGMYQKIYDAGMFHSFTEGDKDIIFSIHRGLTSSIHPSSVNAISKLDKGCTIFQELSLACDSIFRINFMQYYKGLDGVTRTRNMSNTRLDGILRNIRQTLKTRNNKFVPGVCTAIGENHAEIQGVAIDGTKRNDKLTNIKFTIPNSNIEVRVSLDGKVTFKRNGDKLETLSLGTDFDSVLSFINKITGLNINEKMLESIGGKGNASLGLNKLTEFASRSLLLSYVSNVELSGITSKSKIDSKIEKLFGKGAVRVDTSMREIDLIHSKDADTLERLANAIAIEQGLYSTSQVKSGNGNSQSQQSLSRLLGSLMSQWELLNKQPDSATRDCLIMNTHILKGIYTAKEYYDLTQTKEHTDFNVNEFATSMFLHDFIGGLNQTSTYGALTGNGIIALIPSVNSDKNTIGRILIDTNAIVEVNGQQKRLRDLNSEEFESLIADQLGTMYQRVIDRINQDFRSILGPKGIGLFYTKQSFDTFNETHKTIDPKTGQWTGKYDSARALNAFVKEYNLTHRNAPISITDQIHFIEGEDGSIKLNETLLNFQDEFVTEPGVTGELSNFHQFMQHKKADIIGSLLRSGFKVDLTKDTPETRFLLDKNNMDQSWVDQRHGELIIGKVQIGGDIRTIRNKNDLQNIIKEVRSRVLPKIQSAIAKAYNEGDNAKLLYLNSLDSKLRNADILYNPQLLSDLTEFGVYLNLNPLLEQYNYMDYLFTQEFMNTAVGSLIAHPGKGKIENVEQEEAARYQAQHKRNVSYTATMQEFTLGLLSGIPSEYNIAVVDDIKDQQYNVTGEEDTVKPFDGATFVNPFVVYLENVSLGAAKAGITKKQFVHFYDEHTANGGIIKTCGFGLTNDWMRNSPLLLRMMRKMTSGQWFGINGEPVDIDITKDYEGNNIVYNKNNNYFKKNGKYYQITSIEKIGFNKYNVVGKEINVETRPGLLECKFVGAGNEISLNELFGDSTGVTVDSNYALWNLFGGMNSLELDGTTLKPSESSIKNVVRAMNSIGLSATTGLTLTAEEIENAQTQDDIYQPLKHADIHYVATAGAVKQGGANINKNSVYHDNEPYNFMKIHMNLAGIQLDKEHHADGSELSLMTLVINACAHRGYSLDDSMEMFKALRTLTDVGTSELLKPLQEYIKIGDENSRKKVVEATVNTIIKALSKLSLNESDLLSVFADELILQIKTGATLEEKDFLTKLPIDNPAVYAKFMSSISVFLTNSGIKMKIPGILSVLTPSYSIMKTYQVPMLNTDGTVSYKTCKWELIENNELGLPPEEFLNRILHYAPYVFQTINTENGVTPLHNWENLRIGRSYEVHRADGRVVTIKVGTARQYKEMKKNILSGIYNSVQEDIREGRELGNYNVNFKGTEVGGVETTYSLYDLDSILALFELKEVAGDMMKIAEFNRKYSGMLSKAGGLSFKQIEKELRQLVRKDTAMLSPNGQDFFPLENGLRVVSIDGKKVVINESTIQTEAYELVLPKIFINEFGLRTNDQLDEIKDNPEFFVQRLLENFTTSIAKENYDVALKNVSGKHYYIKESLDETEGLTQLNYDPFEEDGKLYRIDQEGNQVYEISDLDDEIYVDEAGNEVIITKNPGFYINHLTYSTIKISEKNDGEKFQNLVDLISQSKNRSALKYIKYITGNNITGFDLGGAQFDEQANRENLSSMMKLNNEISSDTKDPNHPLIKMLTEIGHEMHSSFIKSLEVVASRTPSQSMQSFMPMKIVAFDNPNVNTAFVSTAQIWLLGSDYDVDAVSIAAFDIDSSGKLPLWSPYSDLSTILKLNQSMELPFPTGLSVEFKKLEGKTLQEKNSDVKTVYNDYARIILNYNELFNIRISGGKLHLELVENPDLVLLKRFLNDINNGGLYEIDTKLNEKFLRDSGFQIPEGDTFNLGEAIAKIVNTHNQYLSNVSKSKLTSIAKNYSMYKMYKVIDTPVNLIQAQSSVDAMTGPLKEIGNAQPVSELIKVRTPGNVFDKAESIEDNQVGKDGIGICAVGMKAFFGLTAYSNTVANKKIEGDEKEQELIKTLKSRLPLGPNGRGIPITKVGDSKPTWYNYMSNINPKLTSELYPILSKYNSDTDAALILSALLSLATDNAKELLLSKLNAGTKTIGMYIYGITIGMDFEDISKIMTSKVGWLLTDLTKSNIFTGEQGIFSIDKVFDYIENGPRDLMRKFDEISPVKGKIPKTPIEYLAGVLSQSAYDKKLDPYQLFCKFAWNVNETLELKLQRLENLKGTYSYVDRFGKHIDSVNDVTVKQKFNQAIDALEEYIRLVDIVKNDIGTYNSLLTLSEGGEEFRVLGQILGLNQGLKTKPEEMMQKVFDIQNCIQKRSIAIQHKQQRSKILNALLSEKDIPFNEAPDVSGMFDIVKFCFDKDYQNEIIKKYDEVKHTVNILDVAMTVPHFAGYVQTLALDYQVSRMNSHKFDTMVKKGESMINLLGITSAKDKQQIFRGIGNYYSDYVRRAWMLDTLPPMILPKGTKTIFDGKVTDSETQIVLGTDEGDAAFKYLMENLIIPDLQKGSDGQSTGLKLLKDNKFIKDLTTALLTSTVTHNPIIYYTLPINMLPSTDEERMVFNGYKSEFNKIAGATYKINGTDYPIADLFYYYGLIAHYGKQGRQSIMPIFENLHKGANFKLLSFHAYESAFNEELPDDETVLYPYVLKTQTPYNATSKYIYTQDPNTMVTELWVKLSRKNYQSEIQNRAEEDEISGDLAWYRILKESGMVNGYQKVTNSILRNPEISNYFMVTKDGINEKFVVHNEKGEIKTNHGPIKVVARGTVTKVEIEGAYMSVTDLPGHSDLLSKYEQLRKAPLKKKYGKIIIDSDKYALLLDEALSEEENECNN